MHNVLKVVDFDNLLDKVWLIRVIEPLIDLLHSKDFIYSFLEIFWSELKFFDRCNKHIENLSLEKSLKML